MRDSIWVANRECPPNAKKLSWIPTCLLPSKPLQIAHKPASRGVRAATYSATLDTAAGCGNAFLSNFPFAEIGNASTNTYNEGTRYAGKRPCKYKRNSSLPTSVEVSNTT